VVLISAQCDDWHREHVGYAMKDSEQEGQSDDLLEYYEHLVRVFAAFVKYDVWYPLGELSIYQ